MSTGDGNGNGHGGDAGVRTLLRMRTREGCEARFEEAWRTAAAEISRVPGNLRQELVRDADDPRTFLITSDWTASLIGPRMDILKASGNIAQALRTGRQARPAAALRVPRRQRDDRAP